MRVLVAALACAALLAACSRASSSASVAATTAAAGTALTAPSTSATTAPTTTGVIASPTLPAAVAPAAAAPCGTSPHPPATYGHVVWIWMENHSYGSVIGSSHAPYQTQLARQCGTATHYATVGSPSLPNYLGATAGTTFGIGDDNGPGSHALTADNLFRQVRAAGGTERSYEESMPANCALSSGGEYAVKHNPAAYYQGGGDRSACQADDVPMTQLLADLAAGRLPTFAFLTPNLCDDTHDCSVATGDAWLAGWVPKLLASAEYRAGSMAIVVVYDEYTPVPNAFIAPSVPPGTVVTVQVDHYALLRATEELLGLGAFLGRAAAAPDLRPLLHL
jgi:hypothetical protein